MQIQVETGRRENTINWYDENKKVIKEVEINELHQDYQRKKIVLSLVYECKL